jgi:hypothetical protein
VQASRDKYNMDLEKPQSDDHEAKMAKADCYKLAQYSAKLFKMIDEGEELDGWVQAKITKAADYISSVYHYLEYEQLAREQISTGPRSFEEAVEQEVKTSLKEQWLQKKNQG